MSLKKIAAALAAIATVDAGARAVDIEIEGAETAVGKLEPLRNKCFLIVSYHNYDGTPPIDAQP